MYVCSWEVIHKWLPMIWEARTQSDEENTYYNISNETILVPELPQLELCWDEFCVLPGARWINIAIEILCWCCTSNEAISITSITWKEGQNDQWLTLDTNFVPPRPELSVQDSHWCKGQAHRRLGRSGHQCNEQLWQLSCLVWATPASLWAMNARVGAEIYGRVILWSIITCRYCKQRWGLTVTKTHS